MILKEEEIKYIFNPNVLVPGDILLMNTYEERLREKMGCKYEHAAIYIGDAQIIEANGAFHLFSYAFKEREHACALRVKKCSPITLNDVARDARKQMGREYVNPRQFLHVRDLKNSDKKDYSNRSFCSRLVAKSYEEENIKLVPNPDFCEPDDFLNAPDLEPVQDAVMSISDCRNKEDIINVVLSQQKIREDTELNNPNADLFKKLSELYGIDIQDLNQVIQSALNNPELDDNAIEIIKASGMFKHMDSIKKEMPWFFNDEDFFKHFPNVEKGMHFLYSEMNHYDHTYLPYFREFHCQLIVGSSFKPNCKLLSFLKDYIGDMVDEAIEYRKRLGHLFYEMQKRHMKEFIDFIGKYGIYAEPKYVEKPLDISFILRDMMKAYTK